MRPSHARHATSPNAAPCPCGKPGSCCKTSRPSISAAVPLPRSGKPSTNKVWTLANPPSREEQLQSLLGSTEPLDHKCAASERAGGVCCKDLKGEDERHLISPEIVRDV